MLHLTTRVCLSSNTAAATTSYTIIASLHSEGRKIVMQPGV